MTPPPSLGHRQRQAQATRDAISTAARPLFAEHSYAATTIEAIAAAADIPAPTIYSAFGSKAAILEAIRQRWVAESEVVTLAAAAMTLTDPVAQLRAAAHWTRRQFELGSDVIAVYREAARTDARVASTWDEVIAGRHAAIRKFITSMRMSLAQGLDSRRAEDLFVALTALEVYQILVADRGWSNDRYELWLAVALNHHLLGQ